MIATRPIGIRKKKENFRGFTSIATAARVNIARRSADQGYFWGIEEGAQEKRQYSAEEESGNRLVRVQLILKSVAEDVEKHHVSEEMQEASMYE